MEAEIVLGYHATLQKASTLKRNKNATHFQWKIHWVLFKVLDRDNEPSSFQVMLTNLTKTLYEMIND